MMAHSLGYPTDIDRKPNRKERLSQTSFGHLSINSSMILMVLMAMKRP